MEFEFQILNIKKRRFREKLKELGGRCVHERMKLKRCVYDLCNNPDLGFVRVRSEPGGVTMTSKLYHNKNFPEEFELSIKDSFEEGQKFLESLQLKMRAYQETYREKWTLPINGVREVTIDLWPGLPPYAEVDCESEDVMKDLIQKLGYSRKRIAFGPSALKYEKYYGIDPDVINKHTPVLTFKDIATQIQPQKNHELFDKITAKYRKF